MLWGFNFEGVFKLECVLNFKFSLLYDYFKASGLN